MKEILEKIKKNVKHIIEKAKPFFKQNQKLVLICGGVLAVAVLALGITLTISKKTGAKDNREELTELLKEMGKDFYEDYLYDSLTENDKQNFLERISVTGLKLDLDNLGRYDGKRNVENIKKFVNSKTGEECNNTNTYITIYANAPYEKKDYNIEVTLDCGFEDK